MGFKRILLVSAVIVALTSYWLYTPLPPGYSPSSWKPFQIMSAGTKVTHVLSLVGSYLGGGTYVEIYRNLLKKSLKPALWPPVEGVETTETEFDGIPVRIYVPSSSKTGPPRRGIVYYHGGGWTYGSPDSTDAITRRLSKATGSVVVSVDYRMAPEFPFPASFDDCAKATKYFLSKAADFHVDPKRIAVSGDSAGGNLAATISLKLRDEKFPIPIKLQVLIYPVTQGLNYHLPSMILNKDGPLLTSHLMAFFTAMYIDGSGSHIDDIYANRHVTKAVRESFAKSFLDLKKLPKEFLKGYEKPETPDGDEKIWNKMKGKLLDPYYSPLVAKNLQNLPEAYVFTAHLDPLRDEGYLYMVRLREAGNKVTWKHGENAFHGIVNFVALIPEADVVFQDIVDFIDKKL